MNALFQFTKLNQSAIPIHLFDWLKRSCRFTFLILKLPPIAFALLHRSPI
jgi:hypothetical protein